MPWNARLLHRDAHALATWLQISNIEQTITGGHGIQNVRAGDGAVITGVSQKQQR